VTFLDELYARAGRIKLGLERVIEVLDALGRPQEKTRHIVIAGTNGKGSSANLLSQLLQASGHRVGCFTSPHLLHFSERIRVQNEDIKLENLNSIYERVRSAEIETNHELTFFEFITVMALVHFAEERVDLSVLEVGLGGRLDATNVVSKFLSVVTVIDYDHQEFLGEHIEDIAAEKAGIIEHHGSVVLARQIHSAAKDKLLNAAEAQEATTFLVSGKPGAPLMQWTEKLPDLGQTHYLWDTLATVEKSAEALAANGIKVDTKVLPELMQQFRWPGRYTLLEGEVPVLLDGAHNPGACSALMNAMDCDPRLHNKTVHCVFSTLANRPIGEMLANLHPVPHFYLCPNQSLRSISKASLHGCGQGEVFSSLKEAFAAAHEQAKNENGLVLVTGSLFLVGEMMAHLQKLDNHRMVDG